MTNDEATTFRYTLPEPPPDDAVFVPAEWEALRPQMVTDDAQRQALVAWCSERPALWGARIEHPAWDDAPEPVATYVRNARAHAEALEAFERMSPMSIARDRDVARFFGGEWIDFEEASVGVKGEMRFFVGYSSAMLNAIEHGSTWGQLRRIASRLYELRATLGRVVFDAHGDIGAILGEASQ
ncbi:MAG: hypothetical protein H6721_26755 [Sandaracinus sp.]|nr:hypothetical protein [Sandaracinus sp.]MCB9635735.1 hypothetical protein [Sandaracinus sp.]